MTMDGSLSAEFYGSEFVPIVKFSILCEIRDTML